MTAIHRHIGERRNDELTVRGCLRCGLLVADQDTHDRWHTEQDARNGLLSQIADLVGKAWIEIHKAGR